MDTLKPGEANTYTPQAPQWPAADKIARQAASQGAPIQHLHAHTPNGSCRNPANHSTCITYQRQQ